MIEALVIEACPLCDAPAPPPFLRRADVPVHQNHTAATAAAARAMPRGRLAMAACAACGFVFNRAFDAALPLYGPGYDNTQSLSPVFAAHMDGLARHLVAARGVRGARIIEIGCGQGGFLRALVAWPGAGNSGVGFDPAYQGAASACGGALRFVRGLCCTSTHGTSTHGPDCAAADVVICRHVIEHLPDPLALLRMVRRAAPAARLFFETPDVDWILRNGVVWDFFYEHCSLFSAASLTAAFARAGYAVTDVRRVFGGQYVWLEAAPGAPGAAPPGAAPPAAAPLAAAPPAVAGDTAALAAAYAAHEEGTIAAWRAQVAALAAQGPLAVWGAGAKGATVASLADPHAAAIDCFVDINPAKQGRFLPGTGHPIAAPAELAARGVRQVLAMNPAYRAEIAALLPAGIRLAEWAF